VAIPEFVSQRLRQALGAETTEFIVSWIDSVDSHRADIAELRQEMQVGFTRLESRIDKVGAQMEAKFERRIADLMKWSFVFWVGAVIAIALLAKLLP
jgi:hypothetical protein